MLAGLSLAWSWNVGVMVFLLVLLLLYLLGVRSAHNYHLHNPSEPSLRWYRMLAFLLGLLTAAFLLLSPINTVARTQLFSVHMAQVVLLTTLCAPLLLAGCATNVMRPLFKIPVVGSLAALLTSPLIASVLFNLTFLLWHAPKLYAFAMASEGAYALMMLSILFTSLLNWWPLIGSVRETRTMGYPLQMVYAFFDGQPVDIFAFILVFTGVSLYPDYVIPAQFHLAAFPDQAVAGALLLIPGLVDLVVMTPLFFRWLAQIEQKTQLADQRRQEQMEEEEDEYEEEEGHRSAISHSNDR